MTVLRRVLPWITHNLLLKIFSLGVAILLWFALIDAPLLTTSISAPIEFKNFPAGLDVGSDMPDHVLLQVRGPRDALAGNSFDQTAVVLDLAPLNKPGERTFDVANSIVGLPQRVELTRTVPFQLRVSLENHVRRRVPVRLRYTGPVPVGFRIAKHTIEPGTVVISGPDSQVRQVDNAQTDPFDFGTIDRASDEKLLEGRLHTYVDNPRVRIDSASVVTVKVFLERIRD